MLKQNFTLIFFSVILLFTACKKSDDGASNGGGGLTPATIASVTVPTGTTLTGPKNTIITITGTNFLADLSKIEVKVNGKSCTVLSATSTTITAKIPPACGTGIVELYLNGTKYTGPVFTFIDSYTLSSLNDGSVGNVYGPLATAKFDEIESISFDKSGNFYMGNYSFPKVRKVTAAGVVSLFAGDGTRGHTDGSGSGAIFFGPEYVSATAPDGNIYVGDGSYIRKIDPAGNVTTIYNAPNTSSCMGIRATASGIYVGAFEQIFKISYNGTLLWRTQNKSSVSQDGYDLDGDSSIAHFNAYGNIELDAAEENLYFCNWDYNNNVNGHRVWKIRKFNIPTHTFSTVAGSRTGAEPADGPAASAVFNQPSDLRLDKNGALWIADANTNRVRMLKNGTISTVIGNLGAGDVDGDPSVAKIKFPTGIDFDAAGNLYIICLQNNKIKKLVID